MTKEYRTVFISDVHFGLNASRAELLNNFLKDIKCEKIYLIGDIFDFWKIKRGSKWSPEYSKVIKKITEKMKKYDTDIIYIPGNHDDGLREFCNFDFGKIHLRKTDIYTSLNGRKFLVMHGDEFDIVVRYAKWLAFLGDGAYSFALWINHKLNIFRRHFGLGYWSLSAFLKKKVKGAVNYVGSFENAVIHEAKINNVDGIICGHIHTPDIKMFENILYINTGDWVENCTAVVEHYNGDFELIDWLKYENNKKLKEKKSKRKK